VGLEEEEGFGVGFVELDDRGLVWEFLAELLEQDLFAVPDLDVLELRSLAEADQEVFERRLVVDEFREVGNSVHVDVVVIRDDARVDGFQFAVFLDRNAFRLKAEFDHSHNQYLFQLVEGVLDEFAQVVVDGCSRDFI
jgi:hypothetical protein